MSENRTTFFKRISRLYPETDYRYKLIEKAYNSAKDAFREIKREDGDRYFEHLRSVTLILIDYLRITDHEMICAGILHDIVEDIPSWTWERVELEFNERIANLVNWLTKTDDNDYLKRLAFAPREVKIIKLADRYHNLTTMWACPAEKIHRKIEETKRYYIPMAEQEIILIHEIENAIESLHRQKETKE